LHILAKGWKDTGIQPTDYKVMYNQTISRYKDEYFQRLTKPSIIEALSDEFLELGYVTESLMDKLGIPNDISTDSTNIPKDSRTEASQGFFLFHILL
jgi:hypothetical protein